MEGSFPQSPAVPPNPSLERDLPRHGTWPARRWFLSSASRAKRHTGVGPSAQTLGLTANTKAGSAPMSDLAHEFKKSRIAAAWRMLWRFFPNFSSRHSPIYIARTGEVLWSQGFGRLAYLTGGKVLVVGWALGTSPNERRVFVSQAMRWEPPNSDIPVSHHEREALAALVAEKYARRGERVVIQ